MRIWSLHPALLDRQGLLACWRETLLAQAVLAGRTRGYTRHPQLERFRAQRDPLPSIGSYLEAVAEEAGRRGYRFDASRILASAAEVERIEVTQGQLDFEWQHLQRKLAQRSPELVGGTPRAHPLFAVVPGPVAEWERASLD